jgi:hypothetical protein
LLAILFAFLFDVFFYSDAKKSNVFRYACVGAVVIGFFFVLTLGGSSNSENGDTLRSGQAKRPTIKKPGLGGSLGFNKNNGGGASDYGEADSDIEMEETVQEATDEFSKAVRERLVANQEMLSKAIENVKELMSTNLNEVLLDDDNFEQADIDQIIRDIESKLTDDVELELKNRADEIKQEKTVAIEGDVDLDTEGTNGDGGPLDLKREETKLIVELKDGIDDAAADLRTGMRPRCTLVAKELLETFLLKKLGKPQEVMIGENDLIVGYKKGKKVSTTKATGSTTKATGSTTKATASHHKTSKPTHHKHAKPVSHHKTSTHKTHKKKHVSSSVSASASVTEESEESEEQSDDDEVDDDEVDDDDEESEE